MQLHGLGLRPEGLLWLHDEQDKCFVLWLLWSGVDQFGPFALTKLLFQAYRASALTTEIDPFLVHARSTSEALAGQMLNVFSKSAKSRGLHQYLRLVADKGTERERIVYRWKRDWVYEIHARPYPLTRVQRDWERFSANVGALAA
ncbi:hypothetical protein A9K66_22790 [Mesorhizobium sp. AA23]|nr:hypothetical protein A9K66_22790 [Mesorhizobium sp. AA23]